MSLPPTLLIGTGRMAHQLGQALIKANVPLVGVVGRNAQERAALGRLLDRPAFALDRPWPQAGLVLIAVSDDAIAEVAAGMPESGAVVAHTAGAMGLDVLAPHAHRGVLWPIQSLGHGAPADLGEVPVLVDAGDEHARRTVLAVARSLSDNVRELPHAQRERVHLAAVLAGNFPVFLAGEADRLLRGMRLPPDLLRPLWKATAAKVAAIGPDKALTGPARRGDTETIRRHLDLLAPDPDLRRAYALLSELVLRAHGHPPIDGDT